MTTFRQIAIRTLPLLLLLLALGHPFAISSAKAAKTADREITLNFVGADIEASIKAIGQITGRNFIIDPRVKGVINIVSGRPIPPQLAYQTLVSALRMQGYAVVESANVTKILPEADARAQAGPVSTTTAPGGEQIVTRIFHLRHESATQIATALKPLIAANQTLSANAVSNTLVITDAADNLRRLEQIITAIDVPRADDPLILILKHAAAVDVAQQINRLFGVSNAVSTQASANGGALTAIADPRANRVLLRADTPALLARAATLIASLDRPEAGLGNIRVIHLKHADAVRMAGMLRTLLGSESGLATPGSSPPPPTASSQTGAGAITTNAMASSTSQAAFPGGTPALVAGSLIQADVASNSLIVTAPEPVFNNLQNVVAMLDQRRAQVHLEALIVELTAERAAEFGIQWQDLSGIGKNSTRAIGGTNFGGAGNNIISSSINIGTVGRGFNFGLVDGQINIPGLGTITNLGLLARFLETEANGNILSTPSITTLDNEEAKIVIGQNLPFVTGSFSTVGNTSTVTPFQTYERRDVGLTLKVRPQITQGGVIRVQIYQEVSSVQPGTGNNIAGPTTNKRALESSVLVDDNKVIVLGGLIEDSAGANEEKVPFFGDIPVLRNLFRYENRSRKKTNLMIFLRPRILRDESASTTVVEDRYGQLLDHQQRQSRIIPSPGLDAGWPRLPSLPDSFAQPADSRPE